MLCFDLRCGTPLVPILQAYGNAVHKVIGIPAGIEPILIVATSRHMGYWKICKLVLVPTGRYSNAKEFRETIGELHGYLDESGGMQAV